MKIKKEQFTFLSQGQKVRGTLITPTKIERKIPAVIFFHGMTSSEKGYIPIAEKLAKQGKCGMTLSIRGHGDSEGNFNKLTVKNAVQDGLNAYKFLIGHNFIDKGKIGLCGSSVGGVIVSIVAKQKKVRSLILKAPAVYTRKMMSSMTYQQSMAKENKIFNELKDINDTPSIKALSSFKGSLLLIIPEKDQIIPFKTQKNYLLNAKSTLKKRMVVIKNADHGLSRQKWKKQFVSEMLKWFKATL